MKVVGVIEVYSWNVSQAELMRAATAPEGLKFLALPLSIVEGQPNHIQILWLKDSVSNKMDSAIDNSDTS